jgi:hypothetical protein
MSVTKVNFTKIYFSLKYFCPTWSNCFSVRCNYTAVTLSVGSLKFQGTLTTTPLSSLGTQELPVCEIPNYTTLRSPVPWSRIINNQSPCLHYEDFEGYNIGDFKRLNKSAFRGWILIGMKTLVVIISLLQRKPRIKLCSWGREGWRVASANRRFQQWQATTSGIIWDRKPAATSPPKLDIYCLLPAPQGHNKVDP